MILSKLNCCLSCSGVLTESEKHTSIIQTSWDSFPTRNIIRTNAELANSFFLMERIYVYLKGIVYQQIIGICIATNCASLIDFFLNCFC